jgi:hypothetical protein
VANETLNIRFVNNTDAWNEFVGRINRTLDKLDLEFRMLHDEATGREMYALVCGQAIRSIVNLVPPFRSIEKVTKLPNWRQIIALRRLLSSKLL